MIVGLIPARSGSKRIPNKNIKPLGGYPLMSWSIACAKMCGLPPYVSSENTSYLEIAKRYGGVPHFRDSWAARDESKDIDVITDFTDKIECDTIVFLRPTTPLRKISFIGEMIRTYNRNCVISYPTHWVSLCRMRDGDFYRNTGACEIFPVGAWGEDKMGFIQEEDTGEIDTPEDFDYIEWRLQKYGSPIYDYLRHTYPL